LPADRPITAALRLPERLTQISSPYYVVHHSQPGQASFDLRDADKSNRLHGALCADTEQAMAAADTGADFLVMRHALPASELRMLCRSVSLPVFARGNSTVEMWAAGATGINDLTE
jgi:hypothetical protein